MSNGLTPKSNWVPRRLPPRDESSRPSIAPVSTDSVVIRPDKSERLERAITETSARVPSSTRDKALNTAASATHRRGFPCERE